MAKDYSKNLATAKRLIRNNGRQLTFRKLATASSDGAKPWLGATDPVASGSSVTLYAVAVPPSSATALGLSAKQSDLMKTVEEILICEPGESDPENMELYNTVVDGSVEYKIAFVEKLKPANLTLLYFVGVSR